MSKVHLHNTGFGCNSLALHRMSLPFGVVHGPPQGTPSSLVAGPWDLVLVQPNLT